LIPIELTWFRSADVVDPHRHLAGEAILPPRLGDSLSDTALKPGIINPGRSVRPLDTNPAMASLEDPERPGTPGLAVHFPYRRMTKPSHRRSVGTQAVPDERTSGEGTTCSDD
jgi:hypothetical protein